MSISGVVSRIRTPPERRASGKVAKSEDASPVFRPLSFQGAVEPVHRGRARNDPARFFNVKECLSVCEIDVVVGSSKVHGGL